MSSGSQGSATARLTTQGEGGEVDVGYIRSSEPFSARLMWRNLGPPLVSRSHTCSQVMLGWSGQQAFGWMTHRWCSTPPSRGYLISHGRVGGGRCRWIALLSQHLREVAALATSIIGLLQWSADLFVCLHAVMCCLQEAALPEACAAVDV